MVPPISTFTPTPTETPTPTLNLDTFPDHQIDTKDLLLSVDSIRSGHSEHSVLFLLAERWKEDTGQ